MVLHEPNPMALVAAALARPAAPLIVWFHSEVIRARWKYRLFYQPLLEPGAAARRAHRRRRAADARRAGARPPTRTRWSSSPTGSIRGPSRRLRPAALRARAPADRALRRQAGRLQGRGRAAAGHGWSSPPRSSSSATGRCAGRWKRWRAELGIAGSVRFLGHVTDAERLEWYRRADLLALPSVSRQEAFGMVQVEAMLAGRPVISTALPTGVPWVNRDGESGLVVPPGDVESLRAALIRLCGDAGSADLARHQGPRARAGATSPPAACAAGIDELCRTVGSSQRVAPHRPAEAAERALCAQARARRCAGRDRPGCLGAAVGAHRAVHQARRRRPGVLRPGTLGVERPAVPGPQVPIDDSGRRGGDGRDSGHRARPAGDPRGPRAARHGDGRAAAALEHLSRRHELHRARARSAPARSKRWPAIASSCWRTYPASLAAQACARG